MFFVNYLPEFLYQPLKLSNVRPTDFANSKHALLKNVYYLHQTLQNYDDDSLTIYPSKHSSC